MATNISLDDPIYRTIATAVADMEGGDAFGAGTPRYGNPYDPFDLRRDAWLAGWDRRAGDRYWSNASVRTISPTPAAPVSYGSTRSWR